MVLQDASDETKEWAGEFGDEYASRNPTDRLTLDSVYYETYGVTRTEMNEFILEDMPSDVKILELGCGAGAQLDTLKKMGFDNLTGVDVNPSVVRQARARLGRMILQADATEPPPLFENEAFDIVMTSGFLIHVNPIRLAQVIDMMADMTRRWIWGFEYTCEVWSDPVRDRPYRGRKGLMWAGDYCEAIMHRRPEFRLVRRRYYKSLGPGGKWVQMYLLEKEQ